MDRKNGDWRKASYSGNGGGDCIEVDQTKRRAVLVRNTKKDHTGPVLRFGTRPRGAGSPTQVKRSLAGPLPILLRGTLAS